jgi:hypothetical protein
MGLDQLPELEFEVHKPLPPAGRIRRGTERARNYNTRQAHHTRG